MGVCARQIHERLPQVREDPLLKNVEVQKMMRLPQVREDPFWDGQTSHNAEVRGEGKRSLPESSAEGATSTDVLEGDNGGKR